ncbi:hypothetical protein BU15DRAFT_82459 [Melanogaster broomeanus]|nr:hypothetical protein BU15DRAFT_82459 [Melanogaster broomeanus]
MPREKHSRAESAAPPESAVDVNAPRTLRSARNQQLPALYRRVRETVPKNKEQGSVASSVVRFGPPVGQPNSNKKKDRTSKTSNPNDQPVAEGDRHAKEPSSKDKAIVSGMKFGPPVGQLRDDKKKDRTSKAGDQNDKPLIQTRKEHVMPPPAPAPAPAPPSQSSADDEPVTRSKLPGDDIQPSDTRIPCPSSPRGNWPLAHIPPDGSPLAWRKVTINHMQPHVSMGIDEGEEEEDQQESEGPKDEENKAGEGSNTGDEEQYHEAYYEYHSSPGSDSDYSATERKCISQEKNARNLRHGPSRSQGKKTKAPTAGLEKSQLMGWPLKPGPLPVAAAEGIEALQAMVIERAESLGREFGKSRWEIFIAAGLGLKAGHKENPANVYRKWYYAAHEKPENMSMTEFNRIIDVNYKALYDGVADDDYEAREKIWKPIRDFERTLNIPINRTLKSVAARAEAYSVAGEMQILGAVCYVGPEAEGQQVSGLFTGTPAIAKFNNFRDGLRHLGMPKMVSNISAIARKPGETERDRKRRALKILVGERIGPYVPLYTADVADVYDGPTDDELEARAHKSSKKGKDSGDSEGGFDPEWEVHPWRPDWCRLPDDDPRKDTLPLITDIDGEAVSILSDSAAWRPQFNPVHKARRAKEDPAVPSERPCKRTRDDSEDDEAVLNRIWAEYGPEAAHVQIPDNREHTRHDNQKRDPPRPPSTRPQPERHQAGGDHRQDLDQSRRNPAGPSQHRSEQREEHRVRQAKGSRRRSPVNPSPTDDQQNADERSSSPPLSYYDPSYETSQSRSHFYGAPGDVVFHDD